VIKEIVERRLLKLFHLHIKEDRQCESCCDKRIEMSQRGKDEN
jgi:hypothetical protein